MKKINSLLILAALILSITGCKVNKDEQYTQAIIPEVKLSMQYNYSEFTEVIDAIVNNNKVTSETLNKISNKVNNSIKSKIKNKEFNNDTESELLNSYRAEDTIFLEVKTDTGYNLYKLKVRDNIIVDCVVYQNLN